MVGGQVLDTVYDVTDAEGLTFLNRLKTCAMISGAAELGCGRRNGRRKAAAGPRVRR